ncbi:helix-turn-helix domain-containing protein [Sulfobacillus harzensis]|uniref:Helix-turn-helix domain-containing protein n=1 Tax=Sulfobacillus harzensis TaxID=2729629 RepID=A0A7Y0L6A1_9FIRM|nr:helix-turn-helix domain-containing protein [Sulfobacillus harzensis]NMP23818.1 helix-turn-helix domain-containing protein [Sulfobacillus harzensis]
MQGVKADPDQKAAVLAALRAGQRRDVVAQRFGLSPWTVRDWRAQWVHAGLIPPARQTVTPAMRERMLADFQAGVSLAVMAERYGVHPSTLSNWRKRFEAEGALPPVLTRKPPPLRNEPPGPVETAWLPCVQCGTAFPYRYTGALREDRLEYVLRLCMPCFDVYCAGLPLTEPTSFTPAPEPDDEEDTADD